LHDAATRGDADAIRRAVHMIKGTSAILGARPLAEQCAALEHLSRSGVVEDAVNRVATIEASYRKVEAALTSVRINPHPPGGALRQYAEGPQARPAPLLRRAHGAPPAARRSVDHAAARAVARPRAACRGARRTGGLGVRREGLGPLGRQAARDGFSAAH